MGTDIYTPILSGRLSPSQMTYADEYFDSSFYLYKGSAVLGVVYAVSVLNESRTEFEIVRPTSQCYPVR